jgi:hypothetical protein
MKGASRFLGVFGVTVIAAVFGHELGHSVMAWAQGIPIVPTPAKAYILRAEVPWAAMVWISLGGVATSLLTGVGALIWYGRPRPAAADAVLAGVLVAPFGYSVRYLLLGRGHDGLEWQEAQSAIGLAPGGHAVDVAFLVLVILGLMAWIARRRASLRAAAFLQLGGLAVAGIFLLVGLQVANNAVFDSHFPRTRTVGVPPSLAAGSSLPARATAP